MKYILIILLLFSSNISAKECFKDKQANKQICYKRYFDRAKIYEVKDGERYYTNKNGIIYAIGDQLEVRFNSIGAILFILKEYEVDFIDKTKGEKYILKVRDKNKLFSMLRVLNNLSAIQKALPLKTRKYTKEYVQYNLKKRQEKLEKIKTTLNTPTKHVKSSKKITTSSTQGFEFGK